VHVVSTARESLGSGDDLSPGAQNSSLCCSHSSALLASAAADGVCPVKPTVGPAEFSAVGRIALL
jgi:hypothetical protein